jgi:hypothetical protein
MSWKNITIDYIKALVKPRPISEIIEQELREAYLRKMQAETDLEYSRSIVQYNQQRIERLEKRLSQHSDGGDRD